jgi:hypothetical protein
MEKREIYFGGPVKASINTDKTITIKVTAEGDNETTLVFTRDEYADLMRVLDKVDFELFTDFIEDFSVKEDTKDEA